MNSRENLQTCMRQLAPINFSILGGNLRKMSDKTGISSTFHFLPLMEKNSKIVNIIRHSESWWDENCNKDLEKYRLSKSIED